MRENFSFKKVYEELKIDFRKENLKKTLFNLFLIILGSFILALGDAFFLIPNAIVTGGVSGIGIVISTIFNLDAKVIISILYGVFFLIGFALLGFKFTFKTALSTLVYPLFLFLLSYIYEKYDAFVLVGAETDYSLMSLAGVFGGVLVGTGCAVTFIGGGSTGGVDALSLSLERYLHLKASHCAFTIDCLIIMTGFFFNKNFAFMLIGVVAAFMCSTMINKIYIGNNNCYYAEIISPKWKEINDEINSSLERGTTLYKAVGGFTGEEKVMIRVVFTKDEYFDLQKIIVKFDKKAFITVTHAHQVTGDGFKKFSPLIERNVKADESKEDQLWI